MTRKVHVRVDQADLGGFVAGREVASLAEVAAAFGVSEASARRKLDGLVAQQLLDVHPRVAGRTYSVPGSAPA